MIVAAHQPAYLPWLGYFHKIACADVFVMMDDLQYEAQNFQNRNRVKVNNGAVWLTVPLVRGSQSDRICDKLINNEGSAKEHWQRRSWATLTTHYRRAPYFSHYAEELEHVYARRWSRLLELNLHLTKLMMGWFAIARPILLASSLELVGQKSARILHMCQKLGADCYLSGSGASTGYLDGALLERAGVAVGWQRFEHPCYEQRYSERGFIPKLSALDLILNCGPQKSREVLDSGDRSMPSGSPLRAMNSAAVAFGGGP
jgi:hypothetical protein